jgi:hypothetical protein
LRNIGLSTVPRAFELELRTISTCGERLAGFGTSLTVSEFLPGKELTMKQLSVAIGLLALALSISPPARADDYAVVQFYDGYCRIWWDSAATPWGVGWTKIATGLPDHEAARAVLDTAITQRICH